MGPTEEEEESQQEVVIGSPVAIGRVYAAWPKRRFSQMDWLVEGG